jgi:hypothetical protein
MKEILRDVSCYREMGTYEFIDNSGLGTIRRPRLPILYDAWVAHAHLPEVKVQVKVLLDTGTDITVFAPRVLRKLEEEAAKHIAAGQVQSDLPIPFHEERTIPQFSAEEEQEGRKELTDEEIFYPVFPLTIFLTPEDSYSSEHGFILRQRLVFDVAEVWLGQDIFNQLVFTFHGREGKVSISDPDKS